MRNALAALHPFIAFSLSALAQGTAFTFQGRLNDGPNPANGFYDLRFTIYDSSGGPTVIAGPLTNALTVSGLRMNRVFHIGDGAINLADQSAFRQEQFTSSQDTQDRD